MSRLVGSERLRDEGASAARRVLGVEFPESPDLGLSRRGEERRQRILDAAVVLFQKKGFHGASIDDIGDAAGVTGPALYHYFKDKSEVLFAVFVRLGDTMLRQMLERVEGLIEPGERLDALIDSHVDAVWEHREVFPLLFQEDRNLTSDELVHASERRQFWYDLWAHSLRQLRTSLSEEDSQTMAHAALWLIQSIAFQHPAGDAERTKLLLRTMAHTALISSPVDHTST